ncbi:MAG TPA: hypothetical protein DE312_04870 [Gallionella sp.]|nr:MAG: hypothetical protein A2Z87_07975 [Gallionellales bacterium GWA2_54_124]OGT18632.1 MAG: hypothetical protein A2522_00305 [Gallionellales bacterium RIFOXYD12_FULL_53_10]HCI52637.1 hypothetical protein [Gallionella sp.]
MIDRILRPFSYLFIGHRHKWAVDWIYPFILTVLVMILLLWMKKYGQVSLYGDGGLIGRILGFIQNLPGFFIAALAAIATFNRVDIDKTMPFPAPTLDITVQGKTVAIELTRRRFLCSMFAFLTAENIILVVFAIFAQSFYLPAKLYFTSSYHALVSGSFMFIFLFMLSQMMVTTFWGLFYLGDKLHQPDA